MYSFTSAELLLHLAGELPQPLQPLLMQQLETNKGLAAEFETIAKEIEIVENIQFAPSDSFMKNLAHRMSALEKKERIIVS